MSASYPSPLRRTALIPSLIGAIALLAGVALIETDTFTVIRYVVSIFAAIVAVFAWQARQWWWMPPLAAIVVLWNPVLPIDLGAPEVWLGLQYGAALVFIAAGILIKAADTSGSTKGATKGSTKR